jgi:AcrR family transcriptional regulator
MATAPANPLPVPRSLPRGRHAAARDVVLASQRGRLLEAIAANVAERGYAETTVAQVIARAGVSRKTFYEHFADKRACFLAAWEAGTDLVVDQILAAAVDGQPWRARLRAGVDVFLEVLAAEPAFARTFLIEVLTVGGDALERRARIHDRFAEVLADAYDYAQEQGAGLGPVPPFVFRAAAGAVSEMLAEHVRVHGVERLPTLAPQIEALHLALWRGEYGDASRAAGSP